MFNFTQLDKLIAVIYSLGTLSTFLIIYGFVLIVILFILANIPPFTAILLAVLSFAGITCKAVINVFSFVLRYEVGGCKVRFTPMLDGARVHRTNTYSERWYTLLKTYTENR